MAVPANVVQLDGLGTVTADHYNTYLQGASGLNGLSGFGTGGLQNFAGVEGMSVYVPGLTSINDGNQGLFYWNAAGSANDGVNNVQPNGASLGCWTRINNVLTGTQNLTSAINFANGGNVPSATTTPIGAAPGNNVTVTGIVAISAFDTVQAGTWREVTFNSSLTLIYNATSFILPTAANITTAAGDTAIFLSLGSGNWKCIVYQRASGQPLVSTGFVVNVQTFTSTSTYTPTTGMAYCNVRMIGGGAGAGGIGSVPTSAATSGASAGEYAEGSFSAAVIGSSQTVTIGAGGAGGSAGGSSGNAGSTTSLGSLLTAVGGNPTSGTNTDTTITTPSLGGTGGTGTGTHFPGMTGTCGFYLSGACAGGTGANSQFGSGGLLGSNGAGGSAVGYGAGGGGTSVTISGTGYAGGSGSPGIAIITEFCT